MSEPDGDPESAVRAACDAGRWNDATTAALQRYGGELIEYLVATGRSEADASDAFSLFAERLWRTLPGFRWESSLRSWCYLLARRALIDVKRGSGRRTVALDEAPEIEAAAAAVRTRTLTFMRTATRDAFAEMRAGLSSEDAELLVLRLDRRMPWRDVARVMSDGEALDAAALERRAAALRKRFEVLKGKLRTLVATVRGE